MREGRGGGSIDWGADGGGGVMLIRVKSNFQLLSSVCEGRGRACVCE